MMRFLGRTLLGVVGLMLSAPVARADFTYVNFSSVNSTTGGQTLQLNGTAQVGAGVGNVLRLTPATTGQSGSAFTTPAVSLGMNASFSTYFQFKMTNPGGITDSFGQTGADGIVFVVQTQASNVGGAGGGLGYQGISPSIGIEFDTWFNGEFNDPNSNHVGVDINGSVVSSVIVNEPIAFNNGQTWNAWVDYNGNTNTLEVRWSTNTLRPTAAQLTYSVNLPALLGTNNAYVGFTGGTGGAYENQDILHWQFNQSFNPIGSAVPEPASLTLLGLGALGALGYARRRKKAMA